MIEGFCIESFLDCNSDLKPLYDGKHTEEILRYMSDFGYDEIKEGIRKFHTDFEPYSEELYLKQFHKIAKSVENGIFVDGFEHFCQIGYRDIINYKMLWYNRLPNGISLADIKKYSPIFSLEINSFLEVNEDLKSLVKEGSIGEFWELLKSEVLNELRLGLRRFHPLYRAFDESKYLDINIDVNNAIKTGAFKDGFEHFLKFGYKEIVWSKSREWILQPNQPNIIINNFDIDSYKIANSIENSNIELYLKEKGFYNISQGREFFHNFYESFDENRYIQKFPEIEVLVKRGIYLTPFEHFAIRGYQEILNGDREWPQKEQMPLPATINIVFGLKKSILDRYTDILDTKSDTVFVEAEQLRVNNISNIDQVAYYINKINKKDIDSDLFVSTLYITLESIENIDFVNKLIEEAISKEIDTDIKIIIDNPFEDSITLTKIESYRVLYIKALEKFYRYNPVYTTLKNTLKQYISTQLAEVDSTEYKSYRYSLKKRLFDTVLLADEFDRVFIEGIFDIEDICNSSGDIRVNRLCNILLEKEFDKDWYLNRYEDISNKKEIDLLIHYKKYGYAKNMEPNSSFDTKWYKENIYNDDVLLPFEHYLLIGRYKVNVSKAIKSIGNLKLYNPNDYINKDDITLIAPIVPNPKVSILIPTYNNYHSTLATIDSIIKNSDTTISYEIIVLDDGSNEFESININRYLKNIRVVRSNKNRGFVKNCNSGVEYARGEYILFLKNSTNVQPNWLYSMLRVFETNKSVGAVGGRIVYSDGIQMDAGGIVWRDGRYWRYGYKDDALRHEYNYVRECDYVSKTALLTKKSIWEEVGGFDDIFAPKYYEDIDLAFRLRESGYKTFYCYDSIIVDFDTTKDSKEYQAINREKFYKKWHILLEREHFEVGEELFIARDRGVNSKRVLVVDKYIPHSKSDTYSVTLLNYLEFLCKEGYRVYFIGDDFYDYPDTPYKKRLNDMGVETLTDSKCATLWKNWIKSNGIYLDFVLLCRVEVAMKYIDVIKDFTYAKILYMPYSLYYLQLQSEYNRTKNSELTKEIERFKEIEFSLINRSDTTLLFSPKEIKIIQKEIQNSNIKIVPMQIYQSFEDINYIAKNRSDILLEADFKDESYIDAVIWFVSKVYPKLNYNKNIKLYIAGSNPPAKIKELQSSNIIIKDIDDQELKKLYMSVKIAVVPPRFGIKGREKLLKALYYNVPTITTLYVAEYFVDSDDIVSVNSSDEFVDILNELYSNNKVLDVLSKKSKKYIKDYYSYERTKPILENIFN